MTLAPDNLSRRRVNVGLFHKLSVFPDYIFLSNFLMCPGDVIPELLNAGAGIIAYQALNCSWEMHVLNMYATIAHGGQYFGANSALNCTTVTDRYQCIVDCCQGSDCCKA